MEIKIQVWKWKIQVWKNSPSWRMGSQDGWIRGDRMGPPIYFSHENLGHLEGEQHNPILRGQRLTMVITTYIHWDDPPSKLPCI